jgi:hypothetical protein
MISYYDITAESYILYVVPFQVALYKSLLTSAMSLRKRNSRVRSRMLILYPDRCFPVCPSIY